MQRLYEHILNGLRNSGGFYDVGLQGTFENYLISLQSSVRELRISYRTSCVVMDYSKSATQAAYLIAYYPHYAEMTLEILRLLSYDHNLGVVEEIKRRIDARNDFEILQEGSLRVTSSLPSPQTIRTNLLTGEDGLIPRSRINFVFLALRKGEQISSYFDDIPF